MNSEKYNDISPAEWSAFKHASHIQHGTDYSGEYEGKATTETPGVGLTVMGYEYNPADEVADFTILEKPDNVPAEVIWFALGATIAHVSGATARSF